MTAKEFWEEEPELMWAYRKSYMEKIKMQQEMINFEAWLQGSYFFEAISKSLYNSFGRKNNSMSALQYSEKPYDLNPKSEKERAREKQLKMEAQIKARSKEIKEILKQQGR